MSCEIIRTENINRKQYFIRAIFEKNTFIKYKFDFKELKALAI